MTRSPGIRSTFRAAAAAFAFGLALATMAGAAPVSVEQFFRKPAYGRPELSPNGRYLAVIAPLEGYEGLGVIDLDGKSAVRMKSPGDGDVLRAEWLNDERRIVTFGDLQRVTGEPPNVSGLVAVNRERR